MPVDITKGLKKYIPIFKQASEPPIHEAQTSLRIGKFLEEVLGYNIFQDITKEYTVKDKIVDYAIKLNGKVAFFIEVKQAGTNLREKHIEQASNYAANAGVPWVVLTNGSCWHLYHLTFEESEGIQSDLILSADMLKDDIKDASFKISYLHKKSILKGEHENYYARVKVLSPKSIIQAIFQENVLRMLRGYLKKKSGTTVDEQDLVNSIKKMISPETWEIIGDIKVKKNPIKKVSRPTIKNKISLPPEATVISEPEKGEDNLPHL